MKLSLKGAAFLSLLLGVFLGELCAEEQLFLTGIVRSIDTARGILRIEVTSQVCRGLREFAVPQAAREDLDETLIGKRLGFYIDSSTCERGKVYTILFEKP
jgi:hypothetical protein